MSSSTCRLAPSGGLFWNPGLAPCADVIIGSQDDDDIAVGVSRLLRGDEDEEETLPPSTALSGSWDPWEG